MHYKPTQSSSVSDLQQLIYVAVAEVIRLHPILFAVPVVADTKEPYWGRLPSIDLKQTISFAERSRPLIIDGEGRDRELDALLENQHNTNFKPGYGTLPVWRLIILQDSGVQHQFTACFISHHAISDGIALQLFQNSFQKALCAAFSSSIQSKAEHIILSNDDDPIIPSLEELHPLPIPVDPPKANTTVFNEWTGSPVHLPCKTRYVSFSLSPHLTKSFTQECKRHKVTVTSALPSIVAKLLYSNLPPTIEALTCTIPVNLRADLPPKVVDGVMGNFIDAFKVKLLRSDLCVRDSNDPSIANSSSSSNSMEIWNQARKTQEDTRRYFANTSPSGEPYTNIALFKLIPDLSAAMPSTVGKARDEAFEVSNLGVFSRPTLLKAGDGPIWQAGKVTVSRGAFASGSTLVICVVSSDEGMGFGFTWQEGVIADDVVENVINGVRMYFEPPQEPVEEDWL